MYKLLFKRLMDIFASGLLIILLSPVLVVTMLLVRIFIGKPVFFKQNRPGKNGVIFTILKFRTMTNDKDQNGDLLPDHKRLGPFGRFLRSSSLDELPELFNVFKGDMSLVGPRPLLVRYLPLYNEKQSRRHEVRPGITGLAQVHGRNLLSWQDKFDYDVRYVDDIRFLMDIKILLMTVGKVFKREGISSNTSETMEPFTGNDEV